MVDEEVKQLNSHSKVSGLCQGLYGCMAWMPAVDTVVVIRSN